jgi:hypothetical protein
MSDADACTTQVCSSNSSTKTKDTVAPFSGELSKEGAAAVMQLLQDRNYFAQNNKDSSILLQRLDQTYATMQHLCHQLVSSMRATLDEQKAAALLMDDTEAARRLSLIKSQAHEVLKQVVWNEKVSTRVSIRTLLLDDSLLSGQTVLFFINGLEEAVQAQVTTTQCSRDRAMLLSTMIANLLYLPAHIIKNHALVSKTKAALQKQIEPIVLLNRFQVLLVPSSLEQQLVVAKEYATTAPFAIYVRKVLAEATEPILLTTLLEAYQHHATTVVVPDLDWLVRAMALPGQLHVGMYVPDSYVQRMQQSNLDLLASQGYVVATSQQQSPYSWIQKQTNYPTTALVLDHCVVSQVFAAMLQVAILNEPWVDLQAHVPAELLAHTTDVERLVKHVAAAKSMVVVASQENAMVVSAAMLEHVARDVLPPLVLAYAKNFAKLVAERAPSTDIINGKKGKPEKSKKNVVSSESYKDESTVLPVQELERAILDAYPDLKAYIINSGDNEQERRSMLRDIVKQAFYVDDTRLAEQCHAAIQNELNNLNKQRQKTIHLASSIDITERKDVQVAFEDQTCFPTACYLIQSIVLFMEYYEKTMQADASIDELDSIRADVLHGCCAEFSRRITCYCLLQNGLDADTFAFAIDDQLLPPFYSAIDPSTRAFAPVLFRYNDDGEVEIQPLSALRSVLPNNSAAGSALVQMWKLCGNDSGAKKAGNLHDFISFLQEHCITICGLPFKQFDKKAKKLFLHSRRARLEELLDRATDPEAAYDYAIMYVFQCCAKQHVVFGAHLKSPSLLALLAKERKVSEAVSSALLELLSVLNNGQSADAELVERVKALTLGR